MRKWYRGGECAGVSQQPEVPRLGVAEGAGCHPIAAAVVLRAESRMASAGMEASWPLVVYCIHRVTPSRLNVQYQ